MKEGVMANKRGLSDVVTTVLIILLVLAAIVIIWAFVGPALSGSGESINYQVACQETVVKPVYCTGGTINVQLLSKGKAPIEGIVAIITNPTTGQVTIASAATIPDVLETATISGGAIGNVVRASAVFKRNDQSNYTCAESVQAITCK